MNSKCRWGCASRHRRERRDLLYSERFSPSSAVEIKKHQTYHLLIVLCVPIVLAVFPHPPRMTETPSIGGSQQPVPWSGSLQKPFVRPRSFSPSSPPPPGSVTFQLNWLPCREKFYGPFLGPYRLSSTTRSQSEAALSLSIFQYRGTEFFRSALFFFLSFFLFGPFKTLRTSLLF